MSASKKKKPPSNLDRRFSQVNALLKKMETEISNLEKSPKISPEEAWIVRYRAKGKGGAYWYYKWQAKDPIFETKDGRKTRNKYIGKAGSPAFLEAVEMMKIRVEVEGLKQVHHTLELALFDLIDEATKDQNSD